MKNLNEITLLGFLGNDPEVQEINNTKLCSFRMATTSSWKDKNTGEVKEDTQWHNIEVWGDSISALCEQYLKKGSLVLVKGGLKYTSWEKDDHKFTKAFVKCEDIIFLNQNQSMENKVA